MLIGEVVVGLAWVVDPPTQLPSAVESERIDRRGYCVVVDAPCVDEPWTKGHFEGM